MTPPGKFRRQPCRLCMATLHKSAAFPEIFAKVDIILEL